MPPIHEQEFGGHADSSNPCPSPGSKNEIQVDECSLSSLKSDTLQKTLTDPTESSKIGPVDPMPVEVGNDQQEVLDKILLIALLIISLIL